MIFVTVGTTYAFDSLVEEMDRIALKLKEKVIIQIGNSKYKPKNCQYFAFESDLHKYLKQARIVISHGGAGTSFEVLSMGKKLISIENHNVNDEHQRDLLTKLSKEKYVLWCKDISEIYNSIKKVDKFKFKKYVRPKCTIHEKIMEFVG